MGCFRHQSMDVYGQPQKGKYFLCLVGSLKKHYDLNSLSLSLRWIEIVCEALFWIGQKTDVLTNRGLPIPSCTNSSVGLATSRRTSVNGKLRKPIALQNCRLDTPL